MGETLHPIEPQAAAVFPLFYVPRLLSSIWLCPYDPSQTEGEGLSGCICVYSADPTEERQA